MRLINPKKNAIKYNLLGTIERSKVTQISASHSFKLIVLKVMYMKSYIFQMGDTF